MKSRKNTSIVQGKLAVLLGLMIFANTNLIYGQTDTKSAFETKVDNYLKLYSANFDISNEKITGTGKQFLPDKIASLAWSRRAALVSKATIQDKKGVTTNLRLYFSFYRFNDNKQCKAAMDSLLNCFGKDCVKIKWDVPMQSVNTDPVIFIFNEMEIISCQITCDQENDYWHRFTPDMAKSFGETGSGIMEAGCGGPVTFKKN